MRYRYVRNVGGDGSEVLIDTEAGDTITPVIVAMEGDNGRLTQAPWFERAVGPAVVVPEGADRVGSPSKMSGSAARSC